MLNLFLETEIDKWETECVCVCQIYLGGGGISYKVDWLALWNKMRTHKRLKRMLILITQRKTCTAFQGEPLFQAANIQVLHLTFSDILCKLFTYLVSIDNLALTAGIAHGRAQDLWLIGLVFKSRLEQYDDFLLHGQLSVLTLISVSVQPMLLQ